MDTSLPNLASPSASDSERIFAALSWCSNLFMDPISTESRARLFNFLESPTRENWMDTRSLLVGGSRTLWQTVVSAGVGGNAVPTREEVLHALEETIVVSA